MLKQICNCKLNLKIKPNGAENLLFRVIQVQHVKVKLESMANQNAIVQHIRHNGSDSIEIFGIYQILLTNAADRSAIIGNL